MFKSSYPGIGSNNTGSSTGGFGNVLFDKSNKNSFREI